MKSIKAFTLIELLVVIAIIALLMAIVIPSLRMAKELTKEVLCRSNLRQIGIAIGNYEANNNFNFRENDKWYFYNGTGDLPYEDQSRYQNDLMKNDMLPDYKVFFCPGVRNVSYKKNYRYSEALNGNTQYYEVGNTVNLMETDSSFNDRPAFWSTYAWIWKKNASDNPRAQTLTTNNNASNGVLLCDVPNTFWDGAIALGNQDGQVLQNIFGVSTESVQTIPHGNVLMKDLSVQNPADTEDKFNQWLWNSNGWANMY